MSVLTAAIDLKMEAMRAKNSELMAAENMLHAREQAALCAVIREVKRMRNMVPDLPSLKQLMGHVGHVTETAVDQIELLHLDSTSASDERDSHVAVARSLIELAACALNAAVMGIHNSPYLPAEGIDHA